MIDKEDIKKTIEYLSLLERKIIPFLNEGNLDKISEKSGLDKTSVMRALEFLSNKKIVSLKIETEKLVELGINGVLYSRQGLPERRLMNLIAERNSVSLNDAKTSTGLNDNEFKASIGVLKKKALINVVNENIILTGKKEELSHKSLEEKFLESLPKKFDDLSLEEKYAFENLKNRKEIIELQDKKIVNVIVNYTWKLLMKERLDEELIESITPEVIKSSVWKKKKLRKYDIMSSVPRIYGGKRHFINQAIDYAKKIWLEMGFKEMEGNLIQSSFWNFDALFTAQDHPVRELQDTFFIKWKEVKIDDKKLVDNVRKAHEGKIVGKGWGEKWEESESRKLVLRTHTTCLSAQTLKKIKENKEFPAKYFALGKCFRNETVDWSHGFEFNQTEGIVVDKNANFRQLLGYLKEFFKKMGYEKIRIRPGYFPYTEPSLEIDVYHSVHKKWIEFGGAGMFRPEVTIPIFGEHIPVLAWGPGFDRIIMEYFEITDLRELYKNNLTQLREMKVWRK